MQQYCAFLKQVYFRRKFIQMSDLKTFFRGLDFSQVEVILGTGNVMFNTNKTALCSFIKDQLSQYYAFNIDVFVKTLEEIKFIIEHNPFVLDKTFYTQTFLCNEGFEQILMQEFQKIKPLEQEQICIQQNRLYWHYLKATRAKGNFLNVLARESLKHNFTLRTIGSLQKIYNRMSQPLTS